MRVSKPLRWVLYVVGGLIVSLLLIIILLATIRIPVDLSSYKGVVESAASLAMGRTVKVDDKIVITTSLQPIFSLEGLRISNPKGFEKGDFLKMKTAEIQVRVLPLLLGKIQIAKFSVKGLAVMLVENKQGAVNWSSQTPAESKPEPPPPPKPPAEEGQLELTSDSLVLAKLVLEDIAVDYRRPGLAEPLQFKIEECTGTMLPGKPFVLSMKGKLLKEPYLITVEVGSLQELVEESRSRMEIKTEIAKTRFNFAGSLDLAQVSKSLQLEASVEGDRLDSLNGLLDLDLPPLKSYRTGRPRRLPDASSSLLYGSFIIRCSVLRCCSFMKACRRLIVSQNPNLLRRRNYEEIRICFDVCGRNHPGLALQSCRCF